MWRQWLELRRCPIIGFGILAARSRVHNPGGPKRRSQYCAWRGRACREYRRSADLPRLSVGRAYLAAAATTPTASRAADMACNNDTRAASCRRSHDFHDQRRTDERRPRYCTLISQAYHVQRSDGGLQSKLGCSANHAGQAQWGSMKPHLQMHLRMQVADRPSHAADKLAHPHARAGGHRRRELWRDMSGAKRMGGRQAQRR